MIIKSYDDYYKEVINNITSLFRLSSLFNILWIVSFSYLQLEISVLFIFGFLFTLSLILEKILFIQAKGQFLIPLTFGMYTGWLFIATVVNISATLVKLNWNRFSLSDNFWANTVLIIAVILVFLVNLKNKNAIFPLPIAWAFYGINNFLKSPEGFSGMYPILEKVTIEGIDIYFMYGELLYCFDKLLSEFRNIERIYFNIDESGYGKTRDQELSSFLKERNVEVLAYHDHYIHSAKDILENILRN